MLEEMFNAPFEQDLDTSGNNITHQPLSPTRISAVGLNARVLVRSRER